MFINQKEKKDTQDKKNTRLEDKKGQARKVMTLTVDIDERLTIPIDQLRQFLDEWGEFKIKWSG